MVAETKHLVTIARHKQLCYHGYTDEVKESNVL
jgi:hypothetical protein